MVRCKNCKAETTELKATVYFCRDCGNAVYYSGLKELLEEIGIDKKTINKIHNHITKTKVVAKLQRS